jgi:hypothetical protein
MPVHASQPGVARRSLRILVTALTVASDVSGTDIGTISFEIGSLTRHPGRLPLLLHPLQRHHVHGIRHGQLLLLQPGRCHRERLGLPGAAVSSTSAGPSDVVSYS